MTFGPKRNGPFGTIAEYDDPDHLIRAAHTCLEAGYSRMDAFTPFPIHDLPDAIGFEEGKVAWLATAGGIAGLVAGFSLEWWVSAGAYAHNIGGRPIFSWPLFIPPAYEATILFSAFGAVFSMIFLNNLPQPHHPVFAAPNFERASQDRFFLLIECKDPAFDKDQVEKVLSQTKPLNVTYLHEEEEGQW